MPEHSKEKSPLKHHPNLENAQLVLDALDREIAFYRRRSGQVFFFSLFVEVLILAGREQVVLPKNWTWELPLVYSLFFIVVAVIGMFLGSEYRARIHILKDSRLELLKALQYLNVYPTASQQRWSEIQVLYFVLIFLSSAGIIISWLNWALS